jgi:hypothetical protein
LAAIKILTIAIELKPSYVKAYITRGIALAETNRLKEGLDDFNYAISIEPHNRAAIENRASLLKKFNQ